jgi:hypothetical protein
MKVFVMFFAVIFFSTKASCQICNLDSIFNSRSEIEIRGKLIDFGKSVESQIKRVKNVVFSNTSNLIAFDDCEFYLPVVEQFNHSKFVVGAEFIFVISYVFIERDKRYYYIKELKFIE